VVSHGQSGPWSGRQDGLDTPRTASISGFVEPRPCALPRMQKPGQRTATSRKRSAAAVREQTNRRLRAVFLGNSAHQGENPLNLATTPPLPGAAPQQLPSRGGAGSHRDRIQWAGSACRTKQTRGRTLPDRVAARSSGWAKQSGRRNHARRTCRPRSARAGEFASGRTSVTSMMSIIPGRFPVLSRSPRPSRSLSDRP
jgi:hypothetical protein